MLEEVRITGLGVIEDALLELSPGFTALTGETGAGKPMVVTGLGLLFGGRADPARVRPIVELQRSRRRGRRSRGRPVRPGAVVWQGRAPESDADQLAGLTRVPGGVWVGLFLLVAFAALALGAWLLVPGPLPLPRMH